METEIIDRIEKSKVLGFKTEDAKELVSNLNKLLANYQIHYQKLRNFHWNVKGSDFFELHAEFEKDYNDVKLEIDQLAERIRVFGGRPLSTLQEYLDESSITEPTKRLSSNEMVADVNLDYEKLLTTIVSSQEVAAQAGDSATHLILTQWAERLEKRHWMFTSWLEG